MHSSIAVMPRPPARRSSSARWRCSRGQHAGAATCCARAFARCQTHLVYLFRQSACCKAGAPAALVDHSVTFSRQLRSAVAHAQGTLCMEEQSAHPATTALCAAPWPLLLSRLGDTLMLYLLLHASIFVSLPNGCYLQASGPPVAQASALLPAHARAVWLQLLSTRAPLCRSSSSVTAPVM